MARGIERPSTLAGYCALVTLSVVKLGKLRAISSEALLNSVQQVLLAERLGQKLDRSRLYRLDGHWGIAISGDENVGIRMFAADSSR
jgi:hypothetical protein